jgi:hypothetical protein
MAVELGRTSMPEDETVDLLLALHDECSAPALKKEKSINEFVNRCLLIRPSCECSGHQ